MDGKRSHLVAWPDVGNTEHELQVAVAARHHRRVRQENGPPLRSKDQLVSSFTSVFPVSQELGAIAGPLKAPEAAYSVSQSQS